MSRDELLDRVWGYAAVSLTRTIDNTVRRLRVKIEVDPSRPRHLLTVHGHGYRFEPVRASDPASPPPADRIFGRDRALSALDMRASRPDSSRNW